jgi:hypothetical protein
MLKLRPPPCGARLEANADDARSHFERSLEQARSLGADYEAALRLKAVAETGQAAEGGSPEAEYRELFSRLGVISAPSPPLP